MKKTIVSLVAIFSLIATTAMPVFAVTEADIKVIGQTHLEQETTGTGDTAVTKTIVKSGDTAPTIVGHVEPIQIKAVVPTKIQFNINPNKPANYGTEYLDTSDSTLFENTSDVTTFKKAFTSSKFPFTNECNAPLTFSVTKIKEQSGSPEVVKQDKFDTTNGEVTTVFDWSKMTSDQTQHNIAFGFKAPVDTEWLDCTDGFAKTATPEKWYDPTLVTPTDTPTDPAPLVVGTIPGNGTAYLALKAKYGMAWTHTGTESKTITYDITYGITLAA